MTRIVSEFETTIIREVKHDDYGKRRTANGKNEKSLFSCVYSRVKVVFVFATNGRKRYSIFVCFIYGLEDKNSKSEVVCRFPSAVNVMLDLSNILPCYLCQGSELEFRYSRLGLVESVGMQLTAQI